MERIIGLSMIVVAGIMGNANSAAPKDKAP